MSEQRRALRICCAAVAAGSMTLFSPSKVPLLKPKIYIEQFTCRLSSKRCANYNNCTGCEINLFLRVMRRREDGYHDLASLFHVSEQVCAFGVAYRYWFWHMQLESPYPALVTGVRPAVQVIDLGDTMEFALLPPDAQQDELTCNMEGVPTDESNLVIKARLTF